MAETRIRDTEVIGKKRKIRKLENEELGNRATARVSDIGYSGDIVVLEFTLSNLPGGTEIRYDINNRSHFEDLKNLAEKHNLNAHEFEMLAGCKVIMVYDGQNWIPLQHTEAPCGSERAGIAEGFVNLLTTILVFPKLICWIVNNPKQSLLRIIIVKKLTVVTWLLYHIF